MSRPLVAYRSARSIKWPMVAGSTGRMVLSLFALPRLGWESRGRGTSSPKIYSWTRQLVSRKQQEEAPPGGGAREGAMTAKPPGLSGVTGLAGLVLLVVAPVLIVGGAMSVFGNEWGPWIGLGVIALAFYAVLEWRA